MTVPAPRGTDPSALMTVIHMAGSRDNLAMNDFKPCTDFDLQSTIFRNPHCTVTQWKNYSGGYFPMMSRSIVRPMWAAVALSACCIVLGLTACSTPAPLPLPLPLPTPKPLTQATPPPVAAVKPSEAAKATLPISQARSAHDYRVDAAKHLYKLNGERIFKGRLPPMLYAIGVLDVEVDKQGQVTRTHWTRAPSHAPEIIKEIERTVRRAAPYPVPAHLGKGVYSDVWLWHKSGKFQLDTLTEGQD
jgi:hypothetical protein